KGKFTFYKPDINLRLNVDDGQMQDGLRPKVIYGHLSPHLVLFQELYDAAGSTNLKDQMYVLFQRDVSEEEDWGRVLLRQISEVIERLSQCEAYIAEIKVLRPRLLAVEPFSYMIEIHT
nr:hypothetical protein [Tanacetum cinerariifolium]